MSKPKKDRISNSSENDKEPESTNRDPILDDVSFSQSFILDEIGKEVEKGKTCFEELRESLKADVIRNYNLRLQKAIKAKFPNFVLPSNLAIQKVSNANDVENATKEAWITKANNGVPTEFIFWDVRSGKLAKHKAKINNNNVWVELSDEEFIPGPNRNDFEIFKDPETQRYLVLNKKNNLIYDIADYIKEEGGASHMDYFIRMMQPPFVEVKDTVKEFKLYYDERSDKFELPPRNEIYVRNEIIDLLLNRFEFDIKIDENVAREELNKFLEIATPKQIADFLADLGIPLINLINSQIGANTGRIYICSWGATRTGKTWLHTFAMKYLWGFDFTGGTLQGSAINKSDFRISLILSSTNLPVFIDEATNIDDATIATIKASTLSAINVRGTSSQKAKLYQSNATLILTAQNNIFNSRELSNELALERRFYTNYHSVQINSDDNFDDKLDTFIADTKTRGYAIYLLQKYTLTELKELYFNIKRKAKDLVLTGILFASKLLNLNLEQLSKIEIEMLGTSPLERIVYWIYHDCERKEEGMMNDFEAHKLNNTITLKKKKNGFKYIAININYLLYINSTNHPLKGKFHDLGDLNQLAPFFTDEELSELPGKKIYANRPVRFSNNSKDSDDDDNDDSDDNKDKNSGNDSDDNKDNNTDNDNPTKVFKSACIPYRYNDEKIEAIKIRDKLIAIYKELFYPQEQPSQQPQQPQQSQPQKQDQPQPQNQPQEQNQQPQPTQEPQHNAKSENAPQEPKPNNEEPQEARKQDQKKTTADAIKTIKENEETIEKLVELFKAYKDGLVFGHTFQFAPPEMREALAYLHRNGIIYEVKLDVWKLRGD